MWTHLFNLLVKAVCFVAVITLLLLLPSLDDSEGLLFFAVFAACFALLYYGFFRRLGDYLYCTLYLKMDVTWQEVGLLKDGLSPVISTKWLPMREVQKVPREQRFERALELLRQWNTHVTIKTEEKVEEFKDLSFLGKTLNALLILLVLGAIATSFLNIPPASYITEFYCNLFDTNSYYPMLNVVILCIPVGCLALLIRRSGINII